MHSAGMAAGSTPLYLAPEWLAHRYDPEADAVHLLRAERALRRQAPFLTDEHLAAAAGEPVVARRADALASAPPEAPVHFIFHSAYCCSTLLANAYDDAGTSAALKEPTILNDLVGWRHRGGPPARIGEVLHSALRLLARPFAPGESVVIKPSNVVNALAEPMLKLRPGARALLLHAPLPLFVASIAGKGLWGRLWVRELLAKIMRDRLLEGLGFEIEDLFLLSDLQVAAVGWLAQHRLFALLAERFPGRVATLESEELLARPDEAVAALDRLFGLPRTAPQRAATVAQVFSRHAKFGRAFDRAGRAADQRAASAMHGDEIAKVTAWAETVATSAGVALALPARLLPDAGPSRQPVEAGQGA